MYDRGVKRNPRYRKIIFLVLFIAAIFSFKPLLIQLTQYQLKKILSADKVIVGRIELRSFREVAFIDVDIQKRGVFNSKIKSIQVLASVSDLIKRNISRVILKSEQFDINQPATSILKVNVGSFTSSGEGFRILVLECIDFNFNVQFKDFKLSGRASTEIALPQQRINSMHLDIAAFEYEKLKLTNLLLTVSRTSVSGDLVISNIKYDKASARDITSLVRLEKDQMIFDQINAAVLGGQVRGKVVVKLALLPEYQANFDFVSLDIARFVKDFELEKKFTMTGKISGGLTAKGQGADLQILGGHFAMEDPGGRLIFKDVSFLDKMAYRSSLDGVVESLQDYNYNAGNVSLSLQDNNLLADISLDGKQGKRDFNIVFHY